MQSNVWRIVFICSAITISVILSSEVTLTTKYSSPHVTIKCTVDASDAREFRTYLWCPVVENTYCFTNCTAHCISNQGECLPETSLNFLSDCRYTSYSPNRVSISYQINAALIPKTGNWTCEFKGSRSTPVIIARNEPPTSTIKVTGRSVSIPVKHVTMESIEVTEKIQVDRTSKGYKEETKIKSETKINQPNFLDYMTRPELVLVLILLLGISLLLNLSFLIRCVLLKSVIENYYRGIPNSQCIIECLCLDLVSNKYIHKRYSRSLNLSNQVVGDFYKCQPMCPDNMAIYDDLSAVSNSSARVKMRSNQSSEMDEESRLTNLMPNGGCHINPMAMGSVSSSLTRRYTNPSHAAYFHPGLGNYVIVSGPVASHDQYSVGTGPPGYAIQMVSPIPSAPGSIGGGGAPTHHSASSAHSDESDNDSRTALSTSMTSGMPYRSTRINSHPIDLRESGRLLDMPHNFVVPIDGLDQSLHHYHNNIIRSNGSVPLHPWPRDNTIPTTASFSSLPYYTVSENGACSQEMRNKNTSKELPNTPADLDCVES